MEEHKGQMLLKLIEQRPIPPDDRETIVELFAVHLNFVKIGMIWATIRHESLGKKAAEQQAFEKHFDEISPSGRILFVLELAEVSLAGSHISRPCDRKTSDFVKKVQSQIHLLFMTKFSYLLPETSIKSPKEQSLLLIFKVQNPVESIFIERLRQIVTEEVTNKNTFFAMEVGIRYQNPRVPSTASGKFS